MVRQATNDSSFSRQLMEKEWLEINRLGIYNASTLCGMNSSRFHGLFVAPYGDGKKMANLLAKFEESVFIENRVYEISTNQYERSIYPDGYKYLKKVNFDPFPVFYYEIEDRRLEKTILLLQEKAILIIRYALKNQGKSIKLILKPMIAGRFSHELAKDIQGITTDSYIGDKVVKISPRPDIPELKIYFMKGNYVPATLWYYNYLYIKDNEENSGNKENLFNPGFFSCTLKPYEIFDLYISLEDVIDFDYEAIYRREKELRRKSAPPGINCPVYIETLMQNINRWVMKPTEKFALSIPNYYHADSSLRETILCYYGLMYLPEFLPMIGSEIQRLASLVDEGLLPVSFPSLHNVSTHQAADCSLMFINLMYMYHKLSNRRDLDEFFYTTTRDILDAFQDGTRYGIKQDKDGLLITGNNNNSTSWIPLLDKNGEVIRYGKLCEHNALWYNALKILEFFSRGVKKNRLAGKYAKYAESTRRSFIKKFWNAGSHSLYDLIRDDYRDDTLRIGQIIPLALPFTMLDREKGLLLLQKIEDDLFTPFGLRTLSRTDSNYIGKCKNTVNRSDPAYYMGSVWPWTIGSYVNAVLNYRGRNIQVIKTLLHFISRFKEKMTDITMGFIPELFDGDPPHDSHGNEAYALNSTEIIRSYIQLSQITEKEE